MRVATRRRVRCDSAGRSMASSDGRQVAFTAMTVSDTSPDQLAHDAAAALAGASGVEKHDVALVLGSGWVPAVDALGTADFEATVTDLPGFLPPAVEGHA